ncbi:MAG: hypothetical protein AAF447_02205 [Myxococcota bacterium]
MILGPFDVDGEGPGGWWTFRAPEPYLEAVGWPVLPLRPHRRGRRAPRRDPARGLEADPDITLVGETSEIG